MATTVEQGLRVETYKEAFEEGETPSAEQVINWFANNFLVKVADIRNGAILSGKVTCVIALPENIFWLTGCKREIALKDIGAYCASKDCERSVSPLVPIVKMDIDSLFNHVLLPGHWIRLLSNGKGTISEEFLSPLKVICHAVSEPFETGYSVFYLMDIRGRILQYSHANNSIRVIEHLWKEVVKFIEQGRYCSSAPNYDLPSNHIVKLLDKRSDVAFLERASQRFQPFIIGEYAQAFCLNACLPPDNWIVFVDRNHKVIKNLPGPFKVMTSSHRNAKGQYPCLLMDVNGKEVIYPSGLDEFHNMAMVVPTREETEALEQNTKKAQRHIDADLRHAAALDL